MKVTIFENILDTRNPKIVDVKTIYKRIKECKSKLLIDQIRVETDKKKRNELKAKLPSICFSGIFSQRSNQHCTQHSGLVCIDFDHLFDVKDFKGSMIRDKYTFMCFISPSGDGLKVVVKIPADIKTHAASCKSLKQYYKNPNLDNFEDIARVCYESIDTDIFINENSEIYTDFYKEQTVYKKVETNFINDDYEKIFQNLKVWIDHYENYCDGNKHKFLVKFAGALNRFGVPQYISIQKLIYNYQHAASYVKSEDIEKIVTTVYSNYSAQYNISAFEKNGTAYEKTTKKSVPKDFFQEYKSAEVEDPYKTILWNRLIDLDKPPVKPPSIFMIRDKFNFTERRVFTLGNISTISGKAKSKKTFLHSMILATLVSNCEIFNNFISYMPEHKRQVLLFDTEQSDYDAYNVANRIKTMSRTTADNFGCFGLRGMGCNEIIGSISYAITALFKNVGIIVIDQVADLVMSLNDERECVKVVKFLEKLSKDNNIHICCILHQNKMNDFAQGWLGSQLMKKSETIIKVTKDEFDKNITYVESDMMRSVEFKKFAFSVDENGIPYIVDSKKMNNKNDI